MAGAMKAQQAKIESLTERIIRLEAMLEIALVQQGMKVVKPRQRNQIEFK